MKKLVLSILLATAVVPCFSAEGVGQDASGSGLAVIIFLGFIALIVVGQLIPGVMLFFSMLKGLFKKQSTKINHADHK